MTLPEFLEKHDKRFGKDPVFDEILISSAMTGLAENGLYVVLPRESRNLERAVYPESLMRQNKVHGENNLNYFRKLLNSLHKIIRKTLDIKVLMV